jgi:seryl-tRNA synthetase
MHDIKFIRENAADFDAAMKRRKFKESQSEAILKLDEERRGAQKELQELQAKRNAESQKVGEIKKAGGDASDVMAQVAAMKAEMGRLEAEEATLAESLNQHLASLPNVMFDDVPEGADENANKEVRKWGEPRKDKTPEHFEIGEALGMMDAETAAKMSGSALRFSQADWRGWNGRWRSCSLIRIRSEHGYLEVSPPLLVKDNAVYGTNQLPKFAEDLFRTTTDHWLIPTSEVPLTNMVADSILEASTLPRRYTAFTPCFRSEAGAAGKDTRGMIRQHQFYKVEMVSITTPEEVPSRARAHDALLRRRF